MKASDLPPKFNIPFGNSATSPFIRPIPQASQVGVQGGAASLTDGFPPLTFDPVSAGGIPPWGADFNGLLFQVTQWARWQSAGGPIPYDATFQAAIGGYPKGSIVASLIIPASNYISTADDNTSNPDAGGANWSGYGVSTGMGQPTLGTVAPYGYVLANDGTIGNAASNATTLADPSTFALFAQIWNNVSNTWAPLLTSGGIMVARGTDAPTDYAANRQITVPKVLGRALCIAGAGATLTNRVLGQILGEETHSLTANENGQHNHPMPPLSGGTAPAGSTGGLVAGASGGIANSGNSGLGSAHNNMQPSSFWNFLIKL